MGKDTLSSKNQVRICLIVDKLLVSKYTYDFVKWCINNENIVITHIIIQTKEQTLQKPKIKKRIFATNIAPKIPYKKSGCSLNKSGPGLTP